jgi:hypothetical protein
MRAAPDAYRRSAERPAPYNLYAAADRLRRAAVARDKAAAATPPPPLFLYRTADAPLSGPGVQATPGFRTTGAGGLATDIEWTWESASASWARRQDGTPHLDSNGEPVRAANVILRITPYRDSGVRDSVGAIVPEAEAVGDGDAWLLSGGRAQQGRWQAVGRCANHLHRHRGCPAAAGAGANVGGSAATGQRRGVADTLVHCSLTRAA